MAITLKNVILSAFDDSSVRVIYAGESFWVSIVSEDDTHYEGVVDNVLVTNPQYSGCLIRFRKDGRQSVSKKLKRVHDYFKWYAETPKRIYDDWCYSKTN